MFRGLTTPSAPTLVAFGIIFLMARPPLLCKEGNTFLFNIRTRPRFQAFFQDGGRFSRKARIPSFMSSVFVSSRK